MKIALPFYDDSTLIFASKMKALLKETEAECITHYVVNGRHSGVSERQMAMCLPDGPDFTLDANTELTTDFYADYTAAVFCRVPAEYMPILKNKSYMASKDRPLFVAFQPGLEFTPQRGFKNRRLFDAVFVNSQEHVDAVEHQKRKQQYLSWGHPYFMIPEKYEQNPDGAIYFFAQAISPSTYNARMHILEILRAIAIANPQRRVIMKLRHLPNENQNHVHQEEFDYPGLRDDLWGMPDNFEFSACSMQEALADAAYAITCTSTAAMDAISAGVPTMIYLDYVENYQDRMVEPMQQLFGQSGLITPLQSVLHLTARRPHKSWLEKQFRSDDFIEELLSLFRTNQKALKE